MTQTTQQIEVKRFDIKQETKVLRALNKFFNEEKQPLSEEKAIERDDLFLLDPANVCLIEAKSQEAKRCFSKFIDEDFEQERNNFNPDYSPKKECGDVVSKYSAEYLKVIINLLEVSGECVKVWINTDYPATFENEHFRIVLAPRVEQEDWE